MSRRFVVLYKLLFLCFVFMMLFACDSDSTQTSIHEISGDEYNKKSEDNKDSSKGFKLSKYMSKSKICDLINQEEFVEAFNIKTKLNKKVSERNGNFGCDYFWEFTDEVLMSRMELMNEVKTSGEVDSSQIRRLRNGSGQLAISLVDLKRYADNFTPVPNEQQLIEWLITENDQNQVIDNLGDSAYWSPVRDGALYVHIHGYQVVIMPMIGATMGEDFENAKKIYPLMSQ